MKRFLPGLLCGLVVALAAGCAAIGVRAPQTFIERAVAAQLSATAVLRSADTLLNAGAIGLADARNARATAANANQAIDLATAAYLAACPLAPGNGAVDAACASAPADARLASAIAVLGAMQTYLRSQGSKP
ncbi:MAG: hypothetical protein ACSLE9_11075 [Burkholderiaceae bacterium]